MGQNHSWKGLEYELSEAFVQLLALMLNYIDPPASTSPLLDWLQETLLKSRLTGQ